MKRSILRLLFILFLANGYILFSFGQCDYFDDFSSPGDWTQVGTLVEVSGGELQYIDGAPDAVQRRVYKELDSPYTSEDCWEMTLEFLPESVGSHNNGQPFTGHNIFTLTETDQDPNHDCPDLDCTGYPPGTQDVIGISYTALNPPDGDLFFRIRARDGTTQYLSDHLTYSELGDLIYVELKKSCSTLTLNIYSDEDKQNPLGDGPVSLDIPDLDDLNYIQHGNHSGGWYLRELTGTIDNVCIERFDYCAESFGEENYLGCEGDGYFVEVNGNIYDESNPNGVEVLTNAVGCDSTVTIDLVYLPNSTGEENYLGCEGDGYSVVVNGTTYDESNPTGTEIMDNSVGCDSIVTINLTFLPPTYGEETYEGCEGDGYSVVVNGTTYDESNPTGTETLVNSIGCDSIVSINLIFSPPTYGDETYDGCHGDGYFVVVNGTTYDESNPTGTETMTNSAGCDSIVTIDLTYKDKIDIYSVDPLEECDYDFDDIATFDLTVLENTLTGGNNNVDINWFEDISCSTPINSPSNYNTGTTYVYVFLSDIFGDKCNSDTLEIELIVIDIPDPGEDNQIEICNTEFCVDFYANLNGTPETGGYWTDDDASGADITYPDCVDFADVDFGTYHFTYTTQDIDAKCDEVNAVLIVDVVTPGNPGEDGEDIFCGSPEYYIDLETYLGSDFDNNGIWHNYDGINISDPNHVDMSNESSGIYYFYYDIENFPCDYKEAVVTIEIIDFTNPGEDYTIHVCSSGTNTVADLENALGYHDGGGYWTDDDQSGVDLSFPDVVDFDAIEVDTYHYTYFVSNDICPEDSATITVIIDSPPFAGYDGGGSLCIGTADTIDLFDYINQLEDSSGIWIQSGGVVVDLNNPRKVVFSNNEVGIDSFLYIVSGTCGYDTAFIFIDITSSPNAGNDYNFTICQNSIINLFDSLGDYSIGGYWLDMDYDTINNPYEVVLSDTNNYSFMYILPENGSCLGDTAYALVSIVKAPNAGKGDVFSVCHDSGIDINLFDHLSNNNSIDGKWIDDSGNLITMPYTYSFENYDTGQYIIKYILQGNSFCEEDTAQLTVNVISAPNAGNDNHYIVCNTDVNNTVNLDSLLGDHDLNGNWSNSNGFDLSNTKEINFSGIDKGFYYFKYKITGNQTCSADSSIITIEVKPVISAGTDKEINFCEGETSTINIVNELKPEANTSYQFIDQQQTGSLNPGTGDIDISKINKGTYYFYLITGQTDLCGMDTSFLIINIVGALSAGNDSSIEICNDDSFVNLDSLLGSHDSGGTWVDVNNSGVDINSSMAKNVSFKNIDKGIYDFQYKIESSGSCPESIATIEVIVNPVTYFDFHKEICPGQSFDIGNNVYDLNNPDGTEILTNIYGCDSIINIKLTEKETDATVLIEDENCFGYGKFIIQSSENTSLPITLDIQEIGSYQITSLPFIIDTIANGNYTYDIIDNDGCIVYASETFTIEEFKPYSININVISDDNSYRLNVETDMIPTTIHWSPSGGLSCDDCLDPVANPEKDTEYVVEITDEDGCSLSDSVFVEAIIIENKDVIIDIPNIFTPNNDQSNDIFYVKSNNSGILYEMYIYDRWGENVFYAKDLLVNDSNGGWDGTFKGKRLKPGVYVYYIVLKYGDNKTENFAGDVLLIK